MSTQSTVSKTDCVLSAVESDVAAVQGVTGLRAEQVLNLVKLARRLRALPENYERFGMRMFYMPKKYEYRPPATAERVECGTVACAVGHGPSAGVQGRLDESWSAYAKRCFTDGESRIFLWLFSGMWDHYDDTPRGAAARIAYFLHTGRAHSPGSATREMYREYLP